MRSSTPRAPMLRLPARALITPRLAEMALQEGERGRRGYQGTASSLVPRG